MYQTKVQIISLSVGTLIGLVALWWWALLGMEHDVRIAASITSFFFLAVGTLITMFGTQE